MTAFIAIDETAASVMLRQPFEFTELASIAGPRPGPGLRSRQLALAAAIAADGALRPVAADATAGQRLWHADAFVVSALIVFELVVGGSFDTTGTLN